MGSKSKTSGKSKDPLDNAPILFPWYGAKDVPRVFRAGKQLEWNYLENVGEEYVGVITLGSQNDTFGIFRMYDYVFPSRSGNELCVWSRKQPGIKDTKELSIELYRLDDLTEVVNPESKILSIAANENTFFVLEGKPAAKVTIPLTTSDKPVSAEFPKELDSFDDFFAVLEVENLYENPSYHGTVLVEILPSRGLAEVHPQDWFNQDNEIDHGYQWITRAARDARSGRIVVDGIRIGRLELDESGRKLRESG